MKTCSKCGQPGEFGKRRTAKDGLKSQCKACDKAYKEANRERNAEYQKSWRKDNPDYDKAYKEANREKIADYNRAKYEANPEKVRERNKAWRKDNPEKVRKASKAWNKDNPDKVREYSRRRRARKAGAAGHHTTQQWLARKAYYDDKCYFCGCEEGETKEEKMQPEHRIPLSRGGPDWPANLVPACDSCNKRKNNKTEFEYLALLERHYGRQRRYTRRLRRLDQLRPNRGPWSYLPPCSL